METGLIGGIERRPITIVEYNSDWPRKFARHARILSDALGEAALRIEHVGSTSVPGLAAKPIVDILVVVADSSDESLSFRVARCPQPRIAAAQRWEYHRAV